MKNPILNTFGICVVAISVLLTAATPETQFTIDEIRMCSVEVEHNSCPVDNPIFQKSAEGIYITVVSNNPLPGTQMRFTWYYLPSNDYFSTFLGTVYSSSSTNSVVDGKSYVLSSFPEGVEILPGNYEVVIHAGENEKPILKTFKVLD